MKNKKLLRMKLIIGTMSIASFVPFAIISCSQQANNNQQNQPTTIDQEVARVNELQLSLKESSLSPSDIQYYINNANDFINSKINGWVSNPNFSYNPTLTHNGAQKQLKLVIKITNNQDQQQSQNSKEFVFNYIEKETVEGEIERLNNSSLSLHKSTITQYEYDQTNETNIKEWLTDFSFNNRVFKYEVIGFQKTNTNFQFKFNVSLIGNTFLVKESKLFNLQFTIEQDTSSPATTIQDEIKRINEEFSTSLIKSEITFEELQQIDIVNLWWKINNAKFFDFTKFDYIFYSFTKHDSTNDKHLLFNIAVTKKGESLPTDNSIVDHITNNFRVPFTLKNPPKVDYPIDKDYLKNNMVDPITSGQYAFATPGGGTGTSSVNPSNGPTGVQPSPGVPDSGTSIRGKVYNDQEIRQLKNTFSLAFVNHSGSRALGTGWILDYKIPENNEYPTTWYIATNAHVIQNLKVKNDVITPERYELENPGSKPFQNTDYVQMKTIRDPQKNTQYEVLDSFGARPYVLAKDIPAANLKTIYIGNDFLYTSPKDFSTAGRWANSEEYADFAVMEVKFQNSQDAKEMTQDYVNQIDRHFKYKKSSFLKNPGDIKKNHYSVIGFPAVNNDTYSREVNLYTSRGATKDNQPLDNDYSKLQNLSTTPWYNTFNGKLGMFDAALGLSFFGYNYRQAYSLETFYNSWGLIYPLDFGNLGPGSSGSMLMDKDGYTVGIHFAADPTATVGLSTALYSEGFNYQGKFGSYNLEGYDLIEGGFPNQRTSYKGNLKRLYGNNFKTKLFPNGLA